MMAAGWTWPTHQWVGRVDVLPTCGVGDFTLPFQPFQPGVHQQLLVGLWSTSKLEHEQVL